MRSEHSRMPSLARPAESALRLTTDRTLGSLQRIAFTSAGTFLLTAGVGAAMLGAPLAYILIPLVGSALCATAAGLVGRTLPCASATLGFSAILMALTARAWGTGGLDSPLLPWLALPPFLAITLGGSRTARPTVAVALGALAVLAIGSHRAGTLPGGLDSWIRVVASHATLILAMAVVACRIRARQQRALDVLEAANTALVAEVAQHQETRKDLDTTYVEMVDIARRAGMGEVATGVLHNVGNALNGVNTSVALAVSAVDRSDNSLSRIADLLDGDFDDVQKNKLATYLRRLDQSHHERRGRLRDELERIRDAAEHVAAIIQAQQQLATTGGVVELVQTRDLVSQSRLLLDASLSRHEIAVEEDIPDTLSLSVDRHRVVQILTNLIGNARDALRDAPGERLIRVKTSRIDDRIVFDVVDTGPGVPDALAETIFTHGFTTKQDGHGFGLHASALAARDLGGQLTLEQSPEGAHFRLRVPIEHSPEHTKPALNTEARRPRAAKSA